MEKKKVNKKVLLLMIVCVLLASAGIGVALLSGALTIGQKQVQASECTLYWNVSGTEYLNGKGLSAREVEKDGYYHVVLAADGEQIEYKVKDKTLVDNIDNRDIMGLEVDENKIITKVLDPVEVCEGEYISKWYVVSVGEDSFKVRKTKGAESGLAYDVAMTEHTGIYDVTGAVAIGAKKDVEVGDCVRVYRNFDKEVIYIFTVRGDDYFEGNIVKGYCQHCDTEVDWYEWTETNSAPSTSKHWRLANNISTNYHTQIHEREDVVIDLNGYTIQASAGRRVFLVGDGTTEGTLSIVDQSEKKTGTLKSTGITHYGGVVQIKTGTLNLYSGTLDASEIVTERYGCGVHMIGNTTFNMYGGTIIGGTTVCGRLYTNEIIGGGGGSVYINKGAVFTMYDGVIRDGKAVACHENEDTYMWGIGGNIDIRNGGTFIMEGGKVINGTADRNGGNVYVTSNEATFIMRGGEISGGKSITKGGASGNVYVGSNSTFQFEGGTIKNGTVYNGGGGNVGVFGTMTMSGGRITGGVSVGGDTFATAEKREDVEWHNVYCSAAGVIDMSGGTIDGYVRINTLECKVKLSGTARITGADVNLSLIEGSLMSVGEMQKGAKVGVTGGGFISEKTSSKNLAYIHSDYEGVEVQHYQSQLFVGKIDCLCGGSHIDSDGKVVEGHYGQCDGTQLEWMPWGRKTNAPTAGGNWYLVTDVHLTAQKGVVADAKITLDLNGYTIYGAESTRVYLLAADRKIHMIITDHSEKQNGKLVSVGEKELAGSCLLVLGTNKVDMYAGTLDGSQFKEIGAGGATLTARATAEFTMYGGTIVGGNTTKSGGTITSAGKFVLHDGIIRDGVAQVSAGNIYATDGELIILGGKVMNGTAKQGGNIRNLVQSPVTISGGTISGGTATDGGNLFVPIGATVNINGGTITEGAATLRGGNIYDRGIVTIAGGTISNGVANYFDEKGNPAGTFKQGIGGNIYVQGESKEKRIDLKITGGTIADGESNGRGGNINAFQFVNIIIGTENSQTENAVVITGGKSVNGGNIFARDYSTLTIHAGTTITDGEASWEGGNICFDSTESFLITGGNIQNGTAKKQGGNISLSEKTNAKIQGGVIGNGTTNSIGGNIYSLGTLTVDANASIMDGTSVNGGNIYIDATKGQAANLIMAGGNIQGGKGELGGNVYIARYTTENEDNVYTPATMTMSGGTISGGNATKQGGNIYTAGNLNMTGGTISSGKAIAEKSNYQTGIGGNICIAGYNLDNYATVTITGGTIEKGEANGRGGNIDAHQNAHLILGVENAENNDLVVIAEGLATDKSENANGGNIFARGNSKITIYPGTTIKNGVAKTEGGNIYHDSAKEFAMKGGSIQDGKATSGGNIYFSEKCDAKLEGGNISGGTATGNGGNIYSLRKITMSAGTITGGTANYGGNVHLVATQTTATDGLGAEFVMNGGIISAGKANFNGGNVNIQRAEVTVNSKKYTTPATMTMNGGTIEGGWAVNKYGGNVYCYGEFTMNGGIMKDGIAGSSGINGRGGNIFVNGANNGIAGKLVMNAGSIIDGKTTERGGNVMLAHGDMEIGTGVITITGGKKVTLNADGTVNTNVKNSNLDLFGSSSSHFIQIKGAMDATSRIGIYSSNTGKVADIKADVLQDESVYQAIFVSDESGKTITLKTIDKILSYN